MYYLTKIVYKICSHINVYVHMHTKCTFTHMHMSMIITCLVVQVQSRATCMFKQGVLKQGVFVVQPIKALLALTCMIVTHLLSLVQIDCFMCNNLINVLCTVAISVFLCASL